MIPTIAANPVGLHRRYNVTKANGEPCDPNAVYFVLRLDDNGDDDTHLIACREAARAYCRVIHKLPASCHLRPVADDLWTLVNEIEGAAP